MIIQSEKEVRLFLNEYLEEFLPNKLGSLDRTIQSQLDLEKSSLLIIFIYQVFMCK